MEYAPSFEQYIQQRYGGEIAYVVEPIKKEGLVERLENKVRELFGKDSRWTTLENFSVEGAKFNFDTVRIELVGFFLARGYRKEKVEKIKGRTTFLGREGREYLRLYLDVGKDSIRARVETDSL